MKGLFFTQDDIAALYAFTGAKRKARIVN